MASRKKKSEDKDILVLDDDTMEESGPESEAESSEFTQNLIKVIDEEVLAELGTRYVEYANKDLQDREQHFERYAEGLERTGLTQDPPKGPAFEGGSDIIYPILTEAAVDFQSAAIEELFPATGPVRINPSLQASPHKIRLAQRKSEFMNRTIIQDMPEYRSELEKLLSQVPLAGNAYRKFWWDKRYKRPRCDFYPVDRVLLPFNASSFYNASRITLIDELSVAELRQRFRTGLYEEIEINDTDRPIDKYRSMASKVNENIEDKMDASGASSEGYRTIFEIYCDIDLPEDPKFKKEWGYAPYILTIDVETQKPIGLYRNWKEDDETGAKKNYVAEWGLMPWRGVYSIGLFHIAGPLAGLLSGLLRGMVDNVQITNMPSALAMYRAGLQGQNIQINAGQITPIELNAVRDIREAIMPVPFNQMTPIVLELFKFLDQSTRGLLQTSLDRIGLDDTTVPVGTQMARIEQGLKVYKAVFARLHESQRRELDILSRLYSEHMEPIYRKDDEGQIITDADGKKEIYLKPEDFDKTYDLMPVSDPSVFSEAQRFARWQVVDSFIATAPPGLFDIKAYYRIRMERMGIPNVEQIMPDQAPTPNDNPATENVKMAMGQQAIVHPDQDHIAHISVHLRAMGDPTLGESTLYNMAFQPMAIEHIKQHVLMRYMEVILDLVNKEIGEDATKMNTRNIQVANKLAEAIAKVHPEAEDILFKEFEPMIQELEKVQTGLRQILSPPPQPDPSQMLVQVQAQEVKNKMAVDNANVQLKASKQDIETQVKQQELALKQHKQQLDEQKMQMQNDQKMSDLDTREKMNQDDNNVQLFLELNRRNHPEEMPQVDNVGG